MALSKDKGTFKLAAPLVAYLVATATTIFGGALVVRNSSGYAAPGSTATGLVALGVSCEHVANPGANGAQKVNVESGVFCFKNSAETEAITIADIGNTCYIVDDETVAKTDGAAGEDPATRSAAGTVVNVDSNGVWVAVGLT